MTNVVTMMIPLWGMIGALGLAIVLEVHRIDTLVGIWTEKLGFHNVWEFWYVFPPLLPPPLPILPPILP